MTDLQHILSRASRRDLIDCGLRRGGWGVIMGLAVGAVVLLFDRFTAWDVPSDFYFASAIAGLIAGILYAAVSRRDRLAIAVRLDRVLRLKDRIGTAQAMAAAGSRARAVHDEEFALLVKNQADRMAESIDVRAAAPVRMTGVWGSAISLGLLLWLGVAFMPTITWGTRARSAATQDPQLGGVQQSQQQAQEISTSIENAVAELAQDSSLDEQSRQELEALDRLAQQLSSQAPAAEAELEKARDESAARLNELADRLAEQSQRDLAAAEELARRFAGMDALDRPEPPMTTKEFTDALRRGEFGKAAQELEELLGEANSELSENDRREAAEHLRDVAEELEPAATQPAPDVGEDGGAERLDRMKEALREQGVNDETIEELVNDPPASADQVQERLSENQVDQEVARELADDLEQLREQREVDEQADDEAREVSDALKRAAKQLGQPPQQEPQQQPGAPSPPASQPQSGTRSENQEQRDPTGQDNPPASEQERSTQTATQPERESSSSAESRPSQQSPDQPTDVQQGDQEQESQKPHDQAEQPRQRGNEQPDQTPRGGPDQRQAAGEKPSDTIRKLAERRGKGGSGKRDAIKRLREAARSLSEKLTPQERERWARQWQQQNQPPGGDPGSESQADQSAAAGQQKSDRLEFTGTQDMDFRGSEPGNKIIAQWLSEEAGPQPQSSGQPDGAQRIRSAQDVAERAVNDAAVQKRYHKTIKRYFGRLDETVKKAGAPPDR